MEQFGARAGPRASRRTLSPASISSRMNPRAAARYRGARSHHGLARAARAPRGPSPLASQIIVPRHVCRRSLTLGYDGETVVLVDRPLDIGGEMLRYDGELSKITPHHPVLGHRDVDGAIAHLQSALTHDVEPIGRWLALVGLLISSLISLDAASFRAIRSSREVMSGACPAQSITKSPARVSREGAQRRREVQARRLLAPKGTSNVPGCADMVACAVPLWLLTMNALVLLGRRSKAQGKAYGLSLKAWAQSQPHRYRLSGLVSMRGRIPCADFLSCWLSRPRPTRFRSSTPQPPAAIP